MEAAGGQFRFKPLLTTLANMQTFVRHIRAGRQFRKKLTRGEDLALAWVEEKTAILLAQGAPYKRTVYLAYVFSILNEMITQRQVLGPAIAAHPGAAHGQVHLTHPFEIFFKNKITPQDLVKLRWGGNNPGAPDEKSHLLNRSHHDCFCINQLPDISSLLLFPSFQPLTVAELVRFGCAPLYPLGMTTDHATLADGKIHSPLAFLLHDGQHTMIMRSIPRANSTDRSPPAQLTRLHQTLYTPELRLALQRLLLDQTPSCMKALGLEPALTLLLFHYFHETSPEDNVKSLTDRMYQPDTAVSSPNISPSPEGDEDRVSEDKVSPFLFFMQILTFARRERRHDFDPAYEKITDTQSIEGALWASRVWKLWQNADFQTVSPDALEDCAHTFVAHDVPRLEQHMAFVEEHRETLRQTLASASQSRRSPDSYRFPHLFWLTGQKDFFLAYDATCGLRNLDNTDFFYFAAIRSPDLRQIMEKATGTPLPAGTAETPETPEEPVTANAARQKKIDEKVTLFEA